MPASGCAREGVYRKPKVGATFPRSLTSSAGSAPRGAGVGCIGSRGSRVFTTVGTSHRLNFPAAAAVMIGSIGNSSSIDAIAIDISSSSIPKALDNVISA